MLPSSRLNFKWALMGLLFFLDKLHAGLSGQSQTWSDSKLDEYMKAKFVTQNWVTFRICSWLWLFFADLCTQSTSFLQQSQFSHNLANIELSLPLLFYVLPPLLFHRWLSLGFLLERVMLGSRTESACSSQVGWALWLLVRSSASSHWERFEWKVNFNLLEYRYTTPNNLISYCIKARGSKWSVVLFKFKILDCHDSKL